MHSENQSKGVHYAKSQRLLEINHAHLQLMESLLDEGKKHNIFKPDIEPLIRGIINRSCSPASRMAVLFVRGR